jgi:nucleotide-binding universal stress UspA family protein
MKILFPTDFSQVAENAFVFALKFASQLKAQITVVHIYAVPEISPWVELSNISGEVNELVTFDEFERFKSEIEILKRIAKENNLSDIDVNYSLRESANVVPAIIDESNEANADMIILGTTGATGLKEMLFGSVASMVMEESAVPVMLIPETAGYRGIVRIGLTLEYTPEEKTLVQQALAVTKKMGAHLFCFHVNIIDQHTKKDQSNHFPEDFENIYDVSFHNYYSLDLEKGILDYCKENKLDMLVMKVHHRNRFRELLSFSLAKKVAHHTKIPLLTFHVRSEE